LITACSAGDGSTGGRHATGRTVFLPACSRPFTGCHEQGIAHSTVVNRSHDETRPHYLTGALDNLIEHFGGLQKLLAASVEDLHQVPGVGASPARSVCEGLSRLAESSILNRYV
jgi:hypothetical protein